MTVIILFGSLFLLIFLSVPIGISIGISTLITMIFAVDDVQLATFSQKAFTALDSFTLMAIPFFILAGVIMSKGGIAERLLDFAQSLVGSIKGGLAIVTVLACMFFAAISGSGPATVAAIGSFMIPAMKDKNYGDGFSSGITAAAGSMGSIIPPSISFILLGVAGGISISDLFIAGVFPGILIGVALMILSYLLIRNKKDVQISSEEKFNIKNVWTSLRKSLWAILTPIIVLGGIYAGFFTPTEASAVAVGYGVIVGVFVYKELTLKDIYDSLTETLQITGSILFMVGLSLGFAYLLTIERIPVVVAEYLITISENPIIVLLLINIFLLIVGAFVDVVASIVILTPILLPVAIQLGVDSVHFGVIMILNLTIGYITPPVGVNLFVASSVGKTPFDVIVRSSVPIFLVMVLVLMIVTYIPQISLFLPNLMN